MKMHFWPLDEKKRIHMIQRQAENMAFAVNNKNENWMLLKLLGVRGKWVRQVVCDFRIFDFYNHDLKIAVEVDGPEHDAKNDLTSDFKVKKKYGIKVFRVRNRSELDAKEVIEKIKKWRPIHLNKPEPIKKRKPTLSEIKYALDTIANSEKWTTADRMRDIAKKALGA